MLPWLAVIIAFIVGEFVGLLAYALLSISREDIRQKKKWWEETDSEKGGMFK